MVEPNHFQLVQTRKMLDRVGWHTQVLENSGCTGLHVAYSTPDQIWSRMGYGRGLRSGFGHDPRATKLVRDLCRASGLGPLNGSSGPSCSDGAMAAFVALVKAFPVAEAGGA